MPDEGTPRSRRAKDDLSVLVVPPTTADGIAITKLLDASKIAHWVVPNVAAVCAAMQEGVGTLVIAEEALVADSALVLRLLRAQQVWSDLPVIVLSRSGREPVALTAILPHGNFSVIERPVRASTLVSLIRSSLRARDRQYQVRQYLAEQEDAQCDIREAEQRFRLLVENITDYAIFMIDSEGRVASWNSGAQHLLGYSTEEIVGQPTGRLFEDEGATLAREMQEAHSTGRATSAGWRVRKDGTRLFVEGVMTAVRDDQGQLLGYSKLMKDITDKRRIDIEREQLLRSERAARSEAERSGRMKDEFLATLSHELRTPLSAVLGWSQVLGQVNGASREVRDGLKVIERNARAQSQIIEDLLDMSGIISGKVRLEMQKVDLASIVEASISAIRPAAEAKGVELRTAVGRRATAVSGDANRLQQVFWNLLTNAVKFTPKGGRVSVTLKRAGSQFEVVIADSGEGIDGAFLPHVFERFRQADASTSRRHGGLGLGLSIVKQLVELHGGSVNAASDGHGKGSTFMVALPVMASRASSVEPGEEAPELSRAEPEELAAGTSYANLWGVKVLVVDDEPDARSLIERLLRECQATVMTAASVREAMEQVVREKPDVLLSDIGMPKEDGYALIRRIRALSGEKGQIPAIAVTAYARAEDRATAIQAGYQLHLAKPVEAVKLVEMVASLVNRPAPWRH
jgi:PAS domain S-box-containing protein